MKNILKYIKNTTVLILNLKVDIIGFGHFNIVCNIFGTYHMPIFSTRKTSYVPN